MHDLKQKTGKYRWLIISLLLFSTTINYTDRQVIAYLKEFFCTPLAQGGFGWTDTDYANVGSAFITCYAGITILAGWVIDKIGTKLGLALSLIVWSVFGTLSAFAGSLVAVHAIFRSLFGIGEAGNFPASIKTVAEWFPKKERALATAIFNSGSNIGAMIAALFVPWCLIYFGDQQGWKLAYIIPGIAGFLWLFFWFKLYASPKQLFKKGKLSQAEYDYIHSDNDLQEQTGNTKVPWIRLLGYRQTWAFIVGKLMTDGIWWFYLFWLPDYLKKQFNMTRAEVMIPTFIVYGIAIIGSIYGASIPLKFINKGWSVYKARMITLLIIAFFPLFVLFTQYVGDVSIFGTMAPILAIGIICIAATAHQAWSANLFTTVSDMFPKKAVASVTGIGAAAGGLGGVLVMQLSGTLNMLFITKPHTAYFLMFIVCALSYLIAWGIMKLLVPKHNPIDL